MVRLAAVIVDTDPGSRPTSYPARRIAPHGPAAAQRILRELGPPPPQLAADVPTWVAITSSPAGRACKRPAVWPDLRTSHSHAGYLAGYELRCKLLSSYG
jgi:hypothetical protein